jgi:hypothetical protein
MALGSPLRYARESWSHAPDAAERSPGDLRKKVDEMAALAS